jgi:hydroxymethylbilane synthase
MRTIRIGTRGSKLALWQAHHVAEKLQAHGLATSLQIIETKGDLILDRALSKIGSKGLFTDEIEDQLRRGTIDIAIHSAKDLQSDLGPEFRLIAFTEREQVHDVLVSLKGPVDLAYASPVLGTSSVRRTAMFRHFYPQVKTVDMRGNLQTRMRKLEEGQCDALVLAYAGVHRMGYEAHIVANLDKLQFIPAVGQGCIAVEASISLNREVVQIIRRAVNHEPTETCLLAERSFLKALQGGCSIPAFALATHIDRHTLQITGGIVSPDGGQLIRKTFESAPKLADNLGRKLAIETLHAGGEEILTALKSKGKES